MCLPVMHKGWFVPLAILLHSQTSLFLPDSINSFNLLFTLGLVGHLLVLMLSLIQLFA